MHNPYVKSMVFTAGSNTGDVLPGTRDPLLVWGGLVHTWTPDGYTSARPLAPNTEVEVLTPLSMMKTLAHGHRPVVHPSAGTRSR